MYTRSPDRRTVGFLLALLTALTFSLATAQSLSEPTEIALDEARAAMQEAIATGEDPFPDRPNWSEAIRHARDAVEGAPRHAATLGLLAEIYTRTNYYGPAWRTWGRYLDAGHPLTSEQTPMFVHVGEELAYSAYQRGDLQNAARIHTEVLDAVPFHKESRVWLGRIRMEQGRPADALPYWEAVIDQDPDDARARYFRDLAEDQTRFGVEAADAFYQGVERYEGGDLEAAARSFERATEANAEYAEAWAWRGRVAFEQDQWLVASRFYGNAADLAPDNDTYRYFRNEAQARQDD